MKNNRLNRGYLLVPVAAIAMIIASGAAAQAREASEGPRGNDSFSNFFQSRSFDDSRQNRSRGSNDVFRSSGSSSSSRTFDGLHQNRHSGDDDFFSQSNQKSSSSFDGMHQNRRSGDDDFLFRSGRFDSRSFSFDDNRGRGRSLDNRFFFRRPISVGFSGGSGSNATFSNYGGFGSTWRSFWN